jgi:hypothetical protein
MMSKKPNHQIRVQFYRNRHGEYSRELNKYLHDGTFRWSVKIEIVDHQMGYIFLDQNNHSISFANLKECKAYADEVIKEVESFLKDNNGPISRDPEGITPPRDCTSYIGW